jgi:hypothetical protein
MRFFDLGRASWGFLACNRRVRRDAVQRVAPPHCLPPPPSPRIRGRTSVVHGAVRGFSMTARLQVHPGEFAGDGHSGADRGGRAAERVKQDGAHLPVARRHVMFVLVG